MESLFDRYGDEMKLYQHIAGPVNGRILFAMAILSEVQKMTDLSDIQLEVNELKELLTSVLDFLLSS